MISVATADSDNLQGAACEFCMKILLRLLDHEVSLADLQLLYAVSQSHSLTP